jgi:hypothetical protein
VKIVPALAVLAAAISVGVVGVADEAAVVADELL